MEAYVIPLLLAVVTAGVLLLRRHKEKTARQKAADNEFARLNTLLRNVELYGKGGEDK